MRHPYRAQDITTAVACQISGAVVLWWADPECLRDPGGGGVTLAARTAALIVEAMTEPVCGPD
jgi:hypothetical protein